MITAMKGYECFANIVRTYGTKYIFYQDAIFRRGLKEAEKYGIKPIMTHSEGAAGSMADGYARASKHVGICMAQSIGSANLTGGIMDGWLACSPIIAITGKKLPQFQYRNSYQEARHYNMFADITKFNAEITETDSQFEFLFRQCYKEATTGKPRPVHFDIMGRDAIETDYSETLAPSEGLEPRYGCVPPHRISADAELVRQAVEEINRAQRPVLFVGRGAAISEAGDEVHALAVKGDIPVSTTPDGKTVIDEADPIWVGTTGTYGMNSANQLLRQADLVIIVGSQTSDNVTADWSSPPRSTRVIQIDIAPEELGRSYPNSIGLCGDAKTVLAQLVAGVEETKRPAWRGTAAALLADTRKKQQESYKEVPGLVHPAHLYAEVNKVLPEDAILVVDTGYTSVWSSTIMTLKKTQNYFRATGSLGWSYPGSLGVKCGAPDRPVVCITGDGGFYYYMMEMETAVRYGINTVTVIDNNSRLNACTPQAELVFGDNESEIRRAIGYTNTPFAEIAEKIGCYAVTVDSREEIGPAVRKALLSGRPAVVEVRTQAVRHLPSSWEA